jgi:16S rRNA (uracil1498-N3)-methyltransferase
MPRFFKEDFCNAPFLEGDDARHIAKSLRMQKGERLTVCDTKGVDYFCVISNVCDGRIDLEIEDKEASKTEPTVFVTLYQCLPKGDKMDSVVRQSVESGVSKIVPVMSANCVSRPDPKSLAKKCERWQKIADEAAGQCGRGILPHVASPITFNALTEEMKLNDINLFFYELGGKSVSDTVNCEKNIGIIIGPEGGFTAREAEIITSSGVKACTLGPRIFRTETAPIAALAAVMLKTGNM